MAWDSKFAKKFALASGLVGLTRGRGHRGRLLKAAPTIYSMSCSKHSTMAVDRRKPLLFGAAAGLRLFILICFPSLPTLLTGRVEISTPVTSFKRRTCVLAESTTIAGVHYTEVHNMW